MMDIKKELGKKIQLLRQDRGLSRQAICQDEDILTTRQLQRIEKGEHIPNALTAKFLAKQLGVTVDDLLDETVYFLPKEYQELKYQLFHTSHYGHEEKVAEREAIFEKIYDLYFDNLSFDEQLTIQLLQASMDMIFSKNIGFDQGLIDEFFPLVLKKRKLTFNDLLVIKLYMIQQTILEKFDLDIVNALYKKILSCVNTLNVSELWIVQELCLGFGELYCYLDNYDEVERLLPIISDLMGRRRNFHDKPMLMVLEWKLFLFRNQPKEAKLAYESAVSLCEILQRFVLKTKLIEMWEKDSKK